MNDSGTISTYSDHRPEDYIEDPSHSVYMQGNSGLRDGVVYYDQHPPQYELHSGPHNNLPLGHHTYVDGYVNCYDPYLIEQQHQQAAFYSNPTQYVRPYSQRDRTNSRGRGSRDRHQRYDDQYYGNAAGGYHGYTYSHVETPMEEPQYSSFDGTKPKQFSYQGNRYGQERNHRKRSTNSERDQNSGPSNEWEVEDFHKKSFDEREADEYSYVEKTQVLSSDRGGRGYRAQRNLKNKQTTVPSARNSKTESPYYKYNRRGGYSNSKRSQDSGHHATTPQAPHKDVKAAESDKASQSKAAMTVLRNKGDKKESLKGEQKSDKSLRTVENSVKDGKYISKKTEKEDLKKADVKYKNKSRTSQSNRGQKLYFKGDQDDETQRGSLIEQLSSNSYECMVCCESVRRDATIWSCNNCYNVFHLRCIKKWARSPAAIVEGGATGWRCPACQNVCAQAPNQYRCFCGKVRDPDSNRYDTPHSCGDICGKKRDTGCPHPCNILCHPGPCPVCQATVTKSCSCGGFKMSVKCGQAPAIQCQEVCSKTLNCGRHNCQQVCHQALCQPCEEVVSQVCFCEADTRQVVCGSSESYSTSYSCGKPCDRLLDCSNHRCTQTCHPGVCDGCSLSPDNVKFCPCLKTPLDEVLPPGEERKSCLDAVPTCDKLCDKELTCGPTDKPHRCTSLCHTGQCPPCDGQSEMHCRCGALTKLVPCVERHDYTGDQQFVCDKRCNKKRDCGKHKCAQVCCVDTEHKCDIVCGRKLSCGLHRCEELCHRGNCHTCWNVSFEELWCHCGTEVLYPPVACGTKPPECRKTCTRTHSCGHEVQHNCHSEETCPPCTQLTEKWCLGKHEQRRNIPCHITEISCGMKCNKELPCGQHKCQLTCHKGACLSEGDKCEQPCTLLRSSCAHICAAPCHPGQPCPNLACKAELTLKCECGRRQEKGVCQVGVETSHDYQRLATGMLAMRMSDARDGQSVDISSLMTGKEQANKPRKLECNSECAVKERNRRLALALEIRNPDTSGKLGSPTYTDFLKDYAKKYTSFVSGIEKTLCDLVHSAQGSVKKYRSHAFAPMNRDQRRLIHELAEFYGCTTQSYDEEPKKNVVASAYKDKCFMPSVTLTSLVQREMHPKAPVPIPHRTSENQIRSTVQASKQSTKVLCPPPTNSWATKSSKPLNSWTTLKPSKPSNTSNNGGGASDLSVRSSDGPSPWTQSTGAAAWGQSSQSKEKKENGKKQEKVIDYFEMTD